jgi:hypothetical protein
VTAPGDRVALKGTVVTTGTFIDDSRGASVMLDGNHLALGAVTVDEAALVVLPERDATCEDETYERLYADIVQLAHQAASYEELAASILEVILPTIVVAVSDGLIEVNA